MIAAPPAALTAAPARIELAGAARQVVRVTNPGRTGLVVDALQAGFALGLHGRPRVVQRDPAARVSIRPRSLALRAGETRTLVVSSSGAGGTAGDHAALVLLTTRPRRTAPVGVRLRLGIVVIVRVPGAVVHRLALAALRARRGVLDVVVRNRGNVVERIGARNLRVRLRRGGRVVATLRVPERELLPGARAIVELRRPARVRGSMRALVELWSRSSPAGAVRRSFPIRG